MKKNKVKVYEILFFSSYFLLLVCSICTNIRFISPLVNYIKHSIPFILLFSFLFSAEKMSFRSVLKIFSILIIIMISYFVGKYTEVLYTFLFVICAPKIDVRKFIKNDMKMKIFLTLFVLVMFYVGLANTTIMFREDGMVRNSLGFTHPNKLGLCLFSILCDLFYLHYNNYKIKDYIILIICLLICTFICDSRSSQIGIIALLLLSFLNKKLCKHDIYKKIFQFIPIICSIISLLLAICYNPQNPLISQLDEILTGRIKCAYNFFEYYGINMFGHFFQYYGMSGSGNPLVALDNAYMHILIHYGLLIFIIVMMSFAYLLKLAKKEENHNIYIYIIPFLIFGLAERHIIEIQYNCILLILSMYIYNKKGKEKNEEDSNNNVPLIV